MRDGREKGSYVSRKTDRRTANGMMTTFELAFVWIELFGDGYGYMKMDYNTPCEFSSSISPPIPSV